MSALLVQPVDVALPRSVLLGRVRVGQHLKQRPCEHALVVVAGAQFAQSLPISVRELHRRPF